MTLNESQITALLRNRQWALEQLDRVDAEKSLLQFARVMWPALEPASRTFVQGRVLEVICEHLEAVSRGEIRKLLINVPPGCMKSLLVSVLWPAWEWGPQNRAGTRYVAASYSQTLTIRDNRRCRNVIVSDVYQKHWGKRFTLTGDQNAKERYDNDQTGFRIATSVSGVGTGERGDRFIIDDPHNVGETESDLKREAVLQWFTEVVPTRINDPERSAIVVVMQRIHEQDVSGHILGKELGYEHLCLPMEYETDHPFVCKKDWRKEDGELLWPERFSGEYLNTDLKPVLESWGGSYAVAGQLQQRPSSRLGGIVKRDDLKFVDNAGYGGVVVRGWDLAGSMNNKAAYTCGVKLRMMPDGRVLVEDVKRFRGTYLEVYQAIQDCAERDGLECKIDVPQDPGQASLAQRGTIAGMLHGYAVSFSPESGSKIDRARPFAAQTEAGNVYLVRGSWNDTYVTELCMFPAGQYKDQMDATSRAYSKLIQLKPRAQREIIRPELIT